MYADENAGRYDHLHGDEYWLEARPQSADDVIGLIASEGQYYSDWIKQLEETDTFYSLIKAIARDRNNPHYAKLVEIIRDEIRGLI
jgi:hypothetical protein